MKHIAPEQLVSAVPVLPEMTRKQKLERWADLVSEQDHVALVHNLEYWDEWLLDMPLRQNATLNFFGNNTAFHIAAEDAIFKKLGIGDSLSSIIKFFDVTQEDLHEFTCNCGGHISSRQAARRIRNIADPSLLGRIKNWFR